MEMTIRSKKLATLCGIAFALGGCSSSPQLSGNAETVYLNEKVGFQVPGYSYKQDGLVCDLDKALIENLSEKAAERNIRLISTSNVKELKVAERLIAIDINELVTINDERSYVGHSMNEPKLGIMAAYAKKESEVVITEKSCTAFSNLKGIDSAGDKSMCHQLRNCTKRLSAKVIDWLEPQL